MFRVADILKVMHGGQFHNYLPLCRLHKLSHLQIEEHVHACLHLKSQEEIKDVWNHRELDYLLQALLAMDKFIVG
jgi:hypothetical protein